MLTYRFLKLHVNNLAQLHLYLETLTDIKWGFLFLNIKIK